MATAKLHASTDFFKQLSLEFQQLKLTIQTLETFVFRALVYGHELADHRLLLILDQVEVFVLKVRHLHDRLENLVLMLVIAS